jgi:DNA-binding transcriptional MerR regulator|tara:strand:- start:1289 stop:1723 length:435 start_codon:yes stop_codon:yes gene_type:complete
MQQEVRMHTIGKLAHMGGVSTDTLRYYEKEGLIAPKAKTPSRYRLYDDKAVTRIRFIKQAQGSGFTISEVRELLTLQASGDACCEDVRSLAIQKKLWLEHKIKVLQGMSQALDELIDDCAGGFGPTEECAILGALETNLAETST